MDQKTFTRVIFKKVHEPAYFDNPSWDIEAFLLDIPSNYGCVVCYAHVGQHGEAHLDYARSCKPASIKEYSELKRELESIGYSLKIVKKFPSGFVQGK